MYPKFTAVILDNREWSGCVIHGPRDFFDDYGPWKFTTEEAVRAQVVAWALQDWNAEIKPEDVEIEHQKGE